MSADELPPAQRLESPNVRLIDTGIAPIDDIETLRACVAQENTHRKRVPILRLLGWRAAALRSDQE
jgi:hypothetical protein